MLQTYRAIIKGNQIAWEGEAPPVSPDGELHVEVRVDQPKQPSPEAKQRMMEAFERLEKRGTAFANIEDPAAWQREVRKDRPLPGRE